MPCRFRFFLAACALLSVTSAECTQAGAADKTWRNGIVEAKADAGIAMMPGQHDFASRGGLTIDYVQMKGDPMLTKSLIAGELDSYEANPAGAIVAAAHGADIKLVGCHWTKLTYGLFAKDSVNSIQDLKGKNFAISGPGSLPDLSARAVLDAAGMKGSDVHFAVMGSDADRFRALSAGLVDAAAFSTEFLPLAAAEHIKLISNYATAIPEYPRVCTFMSGKVLRERPDDAVAFMAADMMGRRYALAHKDETEALAIKLSGSKPGDPRPDAIFEQVVETHAMDPSMPIPMDQLKWLEDLMTRTGNLNVPFDLTKMVDAGPRTKALAVAGF
jgi:NitT/TauT family transport system substrate-binding protein